MNAAVRAALRMARHLGLEGIAVRNGYQGLLSGELAPLPDEQLDGIERLGGSVLGTSRSADFQTPGGIQRGLRQLERHNVEGLVIIGGEGSLQGAYSLHRQSVPVVGVPASIDNDVGGTDVAIGVDTAINTALDSIDKLKDTAAAFHRAFIVEVMGRHSGWLALQSGIGGGADMILVPEVPFDIDDVVRRMQEISARGKKHFLLVAAEGISPNAAELNRAISDHPDVHFESRLTVLGHVQRGGSPTSFDRTLASRLALKAVEELAGGRGGSVIGLRATTTAVTPIEDAVNQPHPFNPETYRFAEILAG